jgi:hypothetical protein
MPAEFVNRLSELANAEQAPHLSSGLLIASECWHHRKQR